MADFNIEVKDGNEPEALRTFVWQTMLFLRELGDMDGTELGTVLFVKKPFAFCVASLREFRPYEKAAIMALEDIPHAHIRAHALEGIHLRSKLGIIAYYHERFQKSLRLRSRSEHENAPRNRLKRELLKKVLDCIDTLLESLYSGIPAGGAVIELKKMIETSVKTS